METAQMSYCFRSGEYMSVLFISVALASGTKPETGLVHGRAVCQKAWRAQRPADELPGDSQVSKWLEGILT